MSKAYACILTAGVFLGNWLLMPLLISGRTFHDGFFIGLIAGTIVLVVSLFLPKKQV